ncbi:MAG TPA: hypothetical protein VD837_14635, partial [Terriglobales bacterium]|nr:hypothetical protein [Terriglobales bacterium]
MSDISKRIERAEKNLQKGKPEAALAEYLEILDEEPENEAVCHTAADLCVSLARNSEAARLLGGLFDRQFSAGESARAAVTYKKLARIGKPTGNQSFQFAESLAKNSKDALRAYQAALQSYLEKSSHSEAVAALGGIVRLEPTFENYRKLGDVASDAGHNATASHAYIAAGDLAANDVAKLGMYERAWKFAPDVLDTSLKYAQALLEQNNAAAAVDVLAPIAQAGFADPASRAVYGKALLMCVRAQQAAPMVWETYQHDPSTVADVAEVIRL